ncbi:MAG: OB-fold nucleic acid binding domain-containing protein [Phycisphaerales bacterium]
MLDYSATGLSLTAHPVSFIRSHLNERRVSPCGDLADAAKTPDGERVRVAGLVLVRQRPGTAKEVTFMTLEDESGIANLIVWARVYQRYRTHAKAQMLIAYGRVQRASGVVHVVVDRLERLSGQLAGLQVASRDFH